jgi:hypothetical protein
MLLREYRSGQLIREAAVALSPITTFGRWSTCDYRFFPEMSQVSRVQATLEQRGDAWILHDGRINPTSRSANGVFYDGKRLEEPLLLQLGMCVTIFKFGEEPNCDYVELVYQNPEGVPSSSVLTYTGEDTANIVEMLTALRHDVGGMVDRLSLHEGVVQGIGLRVEALQGIVEKVDSLAAAIAAGGETDAQHSRQLQKHTKLISGYRKIGQGLSVIVLLVAVWQLSNGNEGLLEKVINVFMVFAGGGGFASLWPKESDPN